MTGKRWGSKRRPDVYHFLVSFGFFTIGEPNSSFGLKLHCKAAGPNIFSLRRGSLYVLNQGLGVTRRDRVFSAVEPLKWGPSLKSVREGASNHPPFFFPFFFVGGSFWIGLGMVMDPLAGSRQVPFEGSYNPWSRASKVLTMAHEQLSKSLRSSIVVEGMSGVLAKLAFGNGGCSSNSPVNLGAQ